jgi:Tol biopolymer transport system component
LLNGPLSVELWNPDTGAERFVSLDTSTGAVRELPSFRDAWDVATSPDGSRVVFTRPDDADGDPTNTDAELEDGEIWIADADGSNAMKLTDNGAEDDLVRWSPDGALLTFRTNRRGPHELYVMNPDGSDQRPLLPDGWDVYSEHEWSPDGARIVFVGSDGVDDRDGCFDDGELAVLDVASGTVTTLTDDEWYESSPTWSPDGSMIAFTASNQSDERHDIMLMNADGSDLRRLTAYSGYDQSPVWSPDGSMIAFTSDRGLPESERPSQAGWLFVMNADGSGVRQLFTPASAGYPEGFHSWAAAWNAPG